ncbi:MAG: SGNH/GDSL hydrolase family protein [Planctomycetia bacterium]|nr:SGNH/GDSL hydrolase family protein [Planctomycetia bacterium]
MKRFAGLLVLIAVFQFLPVRFACAEDDFFFKSGDRVLFLGDSITEQYQYSSDIELYLTTRFPKWNLFFLNAGIGGDTAAGGNNRFATHVLAEKPTAITINFGMNDGAYGAFDANRNSTYAKSTDSMLTAAKAAGVRVALVSPNAVDRRVHERFKIYFETQKQFYEPLKGIAAKHNDPFVDQYAVTRAVLEKLEAEEATKVNPFPDGVHTAPSGGLLMAHTILTGLHAPALVSDAEVSVAPKDPKAQHCRIENREGGSNRIAFDRIDDAIPLPVQSDWLSLLPYVNQLTDLNWYGLKITGLSAGNYAVAIDGIEVATYSAEQLASGVNLGNLTKGPIYEQGQRVLGAINAKNQIVHQRFRGVVMFNAPDWLADVASERKPKELAKRMDQIAEKQAEVHKLAQPVKHRFEVKPAT